MSVTPQPNNFVFIIGAMKSGTTSLFDALSQHPQICPSRNKEPDFFTNDFDEEALKSYLELWNWKSGTHKIAIESSVAYTKSPLFGNVAKRIKDAEIGKHRFIYMLRHPLKRIESQIRHGVYAGWGKSLDEDLDKTAIDFSSYYRQLEAYYPYFDKEQFLIVFLEDFKHEPDAVLKRICQFLDLDDNFSFSNAGEVRNSGNFFNSGGVIAWATQNRFGKWIAQNLLSQNMKFYIRKLLTIFSNSKPTTKGSSSHLGRWQLNDSEKQQILSELNNDLLQLNSITDIDIEQLWNISLKHESQQGTE